MGVAVITGAGSGMGKELSYQIVQKGGFVIGIDRKCNSCPVIATTYPE